MPVAPPAGTLVRMADDSVIWTGSARREAPVANGASMDAVVRALSALAVETVGSLVAEADAAMRRSPPAASARGRD